MIDTLSLLLSHFLMFFVAWKMLVHPDLNTEPDPSGRHFKQIRPRAPKPENEGETPPEETPRA